LEAIFLQAKKLSRDAIQEERFSLLEDNLKFLQWRLKNLKSLEHSYKSLLTKNNVEISKLIIERRDDFPSFPGIVPIKRLVPSVPDLNINIAKSTKTNVKARLSNANKSTYLLFSKN